MSDFGNRLREAMQKKEISASELSRKSGIGKNMISYYLAGKCLAKQDKVYMLARALDVDPGWLMTGIEQKREDKPIVIPDTETFRNIMMHMSAEDYDIVMAAFSRAEARMKEKGEL